MPDKIKEAFEAVKDSELFLDEDDFRNQLTKDPKGVFDVFKESESTKDLFLDYADFENVVGVKKKDPSSVGSTPSAGVTAPGTKPINFGTTNIAEAAEIAKSKKAASKSDYIPVKDIEEFNKKYKENYNTLAEFVTKLPDERTRQFFDRAKKENGPEFQAALLELQSIYGNPSVDENDDSYLSTGRAHYTAHDNTVHLHEKLHKGLKRIKGALYRTYISELSHAAQFNSENSTENYARFAKDLLSYAFNYRQSYKDKGTIENEAHSVIEPKILKDFDNLYKKQRKIYKGYPEEVKNKQTNPFVLPTEKPVSTAVNIDTRQPEEVEPMKPEEMGFMDVVVNAIQRGRYTGETANILNVGSDPDKNEFKRLAQAQKLPQYYPTSEGYTKFNEAKTFRDAMKAFADHPLDIMTELSLESLSALAKHGSARIGAGAAAGSAIPGVGTATGALAGLGVSSLNLEYSGKIIESMKEAGIDVTDAKSLEAAFQDKGKLAEMKKHALLKGIPVAVFDMISGGLAGRFASKAGKTVGKKLLAAAAEAGTQAGLGGAGEAAGEVAAGEDINPAAIMGEMIGELGPGAVEVATGMLIRKTRDGKLTEDDVNKAAAKYTPEQIDQELDVSEMSGEITPEQGDDIRSRVSKAAEANKKIPSTIQDEDARSQAIDLINEKETLTTEIEGKDEALVEPLKKRIEEIDKGLSEISQGKKMFQGSDFMNETGLKPGFYTVEEVETAKEKKKPKPQETAADATAVVDLFKAKEPITSLQGKGVYDAMVSGDPAQVEEAITTVRSQVVDNEASARKVYGDDIVDAIKSVKEAEPEDVKRNEQMEKQVGIKKPAEDIQAVKTRLQEKEKIVVDKKGKIKEAIAPNKRKSILHEDMVKIFGEEEGLREWDNINTPEFKKKIGDTSNPIVESFSENIGAPEIEYDFPKNKRVFIENKKIDVENPLWLRGDKIIINKAIKNPELADVFKDYLNNELQFSHRQDKRDLLKLLRNDRDALERFLIYSIMPAMERRTTSSDDVQPLGRDIQKAWDQVAKEKQHGLLLDVNGEPFIFMHAGGEGIIRFRKPSDRNAVKADGKTGEEGIYLSRDIEQTKRPGFDKQGNPGEGKDIYYAFVRMKNPYYVGSPISEAIYKLPKGSETISTEDRKALEKAGFDGVIWDKKNSPKHEVIVFEPDQIETIATYKNGKVERIEQTAAAPKEETAKSVNKTAAPQQKKKKRNRAIDKIDPQSPRDFIAKKLDGLRISPRSFTNLMGPAYITPQIRLKYLKEGGKNITDVAADLIRKEGVFENMDEQELVQMIGDFIVDNPGGVDSYAKAALETPDAEMTRYDEEAAWAEEQARLNDLDEKQQDEYFNKLSDLYDSIDESIDALTDEEFNNLFIEGAITEEEYLTNLENETAEEDPGTGEKQPEEEGSRETGQGDQGQEKSLNTLAGGEKTDVRKEYQDRVADAKKDLQDAQKKLDDKKAQLKGKPDDQVKAEIAPFEEGVRKYTEEYQKLLDKQKNVRDFEESQQDLFTQDQVKAGLADKKKALDNLFSPPKDSTKPDSDNIIKSKILPVREALRALFKGANLIQDKTIGKLTSAVENWVANAVKTGNTHRNTMLRNISTFLTSYSNGLPRTDKEISNKLNLTGSIKKAQYDMAKVMKDLRGLVDNDITSMERIHEALDPEFYQDAQHKLNRQGWTPATVADLTPEEKNLYDIIRTTLDYVHDYSFAYGFIDQLTYDRYKGKYTPRLYEGFEIPEDVQKAIDENYKHLSGSRKMDLTIFKKRKEVSQAMAETVLKDPVYGMAKRLMQTETNIAIRAYARVISQDSKLVSTQEKPGFTKLTGKGYGDLDGMYVANYIVEDFKGYFFANDMLDFVYNAFKVYDQTALRQFFKKYRTVFSPAVQLGNFSSNFVFAFISGIDPITYGKNLIQATKELVSGGATYDLLLKNGIIDSNIATNDQLPLVPATANPSGPKNPLIKGIKKIDEVAKDLYSGADNVAKMSAFLSLKDYGYTDDEAIKRVYESFQNYATVGKIWDMASKTPVVGNPFVKFQADLQRILKNAALKRPLTTAAYYALIYAIAEASSNWSDEDDEQKRIRESREFIPKVKFGFTDIPLTFQTPAGEVNLARYISPYYIYDVGDQEQPIEAWSKLLPYKVSVNESNIKGNNTLSLASDDPLLGTYFSALVSDRDFRGKSVRDPNATRYRASGATAEEKSMNAIHYILRSQFPYYDNGQDMYLALSTGTDYYGRQRNGWQALTNMLVKVQKFGDAQYARVIEHKINNFIFDVSGIEKRIKESQVTSNKQIEKRQKLFNEGAITKEQLEKFYIEEQEKQKERIAGMLDELAKVQDKFNQFIELNKQYLPTP